MTMTPTLDVLLAEVRAADRTNRIELRDRVVAYGAPAIEPVAAWLRDLELAAFAVRVLERIGGQEGLVKPVVRALSDAYRDAPTPAIARDIEAALGHLGSRVRKVGLRAHRPTEPTVR